MSDFKIIECPRDAMQGLKTFIPTEVKTQYLNQLLKCGFDTLDFGSFVSPKAIPQLKDTDAVLNGLDLSKSDTKLLAIVANLRGALEACTIEEISYIGFPFSISETFQQRNTNSSIEDSFKNLDSIQNIALKSNKQLVTYISMGFGNPYGDRWNSEIVLEWSHKLSEKLGLNILALSDTIGCATPETVKQLFNDLIPNLPKVEFGAHLHTLPKNALSLIESAYKSGCRRFDGAIKGFGGCPMAKDDLTGNMPTEKLLEFADLNKFSTGIDNIEFSKSFEMSDAVFPKK
jgi:hydroxymethylglutaryl-CoA lyase